MSSVVLVPFTALSLRIVVYHFLLKKLCEKKKCIKNENLKNEDSFLCQNYSGSMKYTICIYLQLTFG